MPSRSRSAAWLLLSFVVHDEHTGQVANTHNYTSSARALEFWCQMPFAASAINLGQRKLWQYGKRKWLDVDIKEVNSKTTTGQTIPTILLPLWICARCEHWILQMTCRGAQPVAGPAHIVHTIQLRRLGISACQRSRKNEEKETEKKKRQQLNIVY